MRDTTSYKTKTSFKERNNGKIPGVWEIAIDVGYSAVKVFSPNIVGRFPSYAKRVGEDFSYIGTAPDESILYKDLETGEFWLIGEKAQDIMSSNDTSDSEASLYSRERYGTDIFRVVTDAGLALGMRDNKFGGPGKDRIVVQTGLPDKYMSDESDLKDVFAKKHRFAIMFGDGKWEEYNFTLNEEDVYVMSQPKGTLFSVCIDRDGSFHKDARKYLKSSVIVFDPGFGTLDVFPIIEGTVGNGETYADLGMKRVLQETTKLIEKNFGVHLSVPVMQKYLATGKVRSFNQKERTAKEHEFGDLLAEATKKVCNEAISRMESSLVVGDFNYMIVTGGTGAAWFPYIKEMYKGYEWLQLIQGNQNDDLPYVYSNVRGYYFYRFNKLGTELGVGRKAVPAKPASELKSREIDMGPELNKEDVKEITEPPKPYVEEVRDPEPSDDDLDLSEDDPSVSLDELNEMLKDVPKLDTEALPDSYDDLI